MYKTKNQKAWELIENELSIIKKVDDQERKIITTDEIKNIGKREPRLMAKFDHKKNLPSFFKKNKLGILPLSRKEYYISKFNMFKNVTEVDRTKTLDLSRINSFKSIDIKDIRSEDKSIIIANILDVFAQFMGEDKLQLTNKGKFGTGKLNFYLNTIFGRQLINVNSSSAELDAGLEGDYFYVVEAKMGKLKDFNIRQLYYPFLFWHNRIDKKTKTIFFTYADKKFTIWEFKFNDPLLFNSIECVNKENYIFPEEVIITDNVLNIDSFDDSDINGIPFPQADDFEKVIDVIDLVNAKIDTKNELSQYFDFDLRQSDYYFNAAKYLHLVDKNRKEKEIYLTPLGNKIVNLPRKERHKRLIIKILEKKVFYDTYLKYKDNSELLIDEIVEIMRRNNVLKCAKLSMFKRRARTIKSWCKWIRNQMENIF